MDDMAPPDDLVTITEGTQRTRLTWSQINYAMDRGYIRVWIRGLKRTRFASLAELREYQRHITEFRPLRSRDDEGETGE